MNSKATASLDMGGIFNVEVKVEDGALSVGLPKNADYRDTFPRALVETGHLLKATVNGKPLTLIPGDEKYYYRGSVKYDGSPAQVDVFIGGYKPGAHKKHDMLYQRYKVNDGNVQETDIASRIELPVELVRCIADNPFYAVPVVDMENYRYANRIAREAPLVSTHTHFSVDDPKAELIDMAIRRNIPIPRRFLDKLGVDYNQFGSQVPWKTQDTIFFFPKRAEQQTLPKREQAVGMGDLARLFDAAGQGSDFRRNIIRQLSIPADEIRYQGGMEDIFEVLEFATKRIDKAIIAERIQALALDRSRNDNCRYMEITTGSTLRKDFILGWQEAKEELARQGQDIRLELKLGVPRHMPREEMIDNFRRAIAYHKLGVCCGIDIMGFEDNKTEDFRPALEWLGAELNKPENKTLLKTFTVQVHAGETSKNPENVNQLLRLAKQYGLRINIGHSLLGWNDETIALMKELAQRDQITVQLLHGSNVSLSAMHDVSQIPWRLLTENNIPFVVDTDGAIYSTRYRSLLASLAFAGAGKQAFDHMAKSQQHYYERQLSQLQQTLTPAEIDAIETELAAGTHYTPEVKAGYEHERERKKQRLTTVTQEKAILTDKAAIDRQTKGKTQVMVFGSSGRSWEDKDGADYIHKYDLSREMREEITIMQEMMVRALDPGKVTFGIGRTKENGGAAEKLIEAMRRHKDKKFFTTAYVVRGEDLVDNGRHELVFDGETVKAIRLLNGALINLAPQVAAVASRPGSTLMLMGGLRSTDDIARCMLTGGAAKSMLLMAGEGVSGIYADKLGDAYSFGLKGKPVAGNCPAEQGLEKLAQRHPGIFMPEYGVEGIYNVDKLEEVDKVKLQKFREKLVQLRKEVESDLRLGGISGFHGSAVHSLSANAPAPANGRV